MVYPTNDLELRVRLAIREVREAVRRLRELRTAVRARAAEREVALTASSPERDPPG